MRGYVCVIDDDGATHHPVDWLGSIFCIVCADDYPCPTVAAFVVAADEAASRAV